MFFVSLLESNFKCKSLFQEIVYLSSTKSTTNELWTYYNDNPKKYLVITDNQTAGKGRGINSWFSVAHKSIVCSFIIEQLFSIKKFNFHSLIIPLSIIKGIKKYLSIDLKIKWPNDIMFENKKVAGILIESKKISDKYILNIGIGININENISDFNDNFCADSDLPLVMDEYPELPIREQFSPYGQDHYLVILDYEGNYIDHIDLLNLGNAQKNYILDILEENYDQSILGDLNGDTTLNIADIIIIIDFILSEIYNENGDMNYDGGLNIQDITILLNIIL